MRWLPMRWVFQAFEGMDILLIRQRGQVIHCQLLNWRPAQQKLLFLLGPPIKNCYRVAC
jgi:hypothetical protein